MGHTNMIAPSTTATTVTTYHYTSQPQPAPENFFASANNVFVALDKPIYCPGEILHGRVLLNCSQPFQAQMLVLKLEGAEKTVWEEGSSGGQRQDYDDGRDNSTLRQGKRDLFKVKIALRQFERSLVTPGQYEFPFTTVLPTNLPGTFTISTGTLNAKVSYKIKAEIVAPGMLKGYLRFKQYLIIQPRPFRRQPHELIVQDVQSVKMCGCFSKGAVSMTARIEKDIYRPGEEAHVILQMNNQSRTDFRLVELSLHKYIEMRDSGHRRYSRDITVFSTSTQGVAAHEMQQGSDARRLTLHIPPDLEPTALGGIVRCEYMLEVRRKAPSLISDLIAMLPITVEKPPPAVSPLSAQPPPDWNATNMGPNISIQLPPVLAIPHSSPAPFSKSPSKGHGNKYGPHIIHVRAY